MPRPSLPTVSAETARRLLLAGLGLLDDPTQRTTVRSVAKAVRKLGFVQVDSIPIVERAHHHILMSRLDGYRARHLTRLLERDRGLFEHWTRDAAMIPTEWFPLWRYRFARFKQRWHPTRSRLAARLGPDPQATVRRVRRRVREEGPTRSRDFELRQPRQGTFWAWGPEKTALEYLWRTGELAITRREGFEKVYDLVERALPDAVVEPRPSPAMHLDWACRTALAALGTATPAELGRYLRAVDHVAARRWCERAVKRGEIEPVAVEPLGGGAPRPAFAEASWRARASKLGEAPRRVRLLSPFDPLVHDRARAQRLFGFDFRFEGFVPRQKRRYGYFVLPVLEGEALIGRADARFDRERGSLALNALFLEAGVRETRSRKRGIQRATERLGEQIRASAES